MSQKKRSGAAPKTGKTTSGHPLTCPSCNGPVTPNANFCPSCGKALGDGGASLSRDPVTLTIYGIIGLCVVGALVGIFFFSGPSPVTPAQAPAPMASPGAPAVDLSSMSPREAADRLFNRIMMADEQGNKEEVMRFLPMALQAYDRVEFLDADAHFHLGLMYAAAGDYAAVRKEINILKQYTPNHLLAMLLEHKVAVAEGDSKTAAAIEKEFKAAYPAEIATNRPEYEAHLNSIEGFRARIGAN